MLDFTLWFHTDAFDMWVVQFKGLKPAMECNYVHLLRYSTCTLHSHYTMFWRHTLYFYWQHSCDNYSQLLMLQWSKRRTFSIQYIFFKIRIKQHWKCWKLDLIIDPANNLESYSTHNMYKYVEFTFTQVRVFFLHVSEELQDLHHN